MKPEARATIDLGLLERHFVLQIVSLLNTYDIEHQKMLLTKVKARHPELERYVYEEWNQDL